MIRWILEQLGLRDTTLNPYGHNIFEKNDKTCVCIRGTLFEADDAVDLWQKLKEYGYEFCPYHFDVNEIIIHCDHGYDCSEEI